MQNFVKREEIESMSWDQKTIQQHMQHFVKRDEIESILQDK